MDTVGRGEGHGGMDYVGRGSQHPKTWFVKESQYYW